MKRNLMASIGLLTILLLSAALINAKITRGNGKVVAKTIAVPEFDGIKLTSSADVEITKGASLAVVLTEYENLIDYHELLVENGVLLIKTKGVMSLFNSRAKIKITLPGALYTAVVTGSGNLVLRNINSLNELTITGSGDVVSQTKESYRNLVIKVTGSGDVNMNGTAEYADVLVTGSGDVNFSDLKVQSADCKITGSGDIKVTVQNKLKAMISGSGDITYFGDPQVENRISGSGDLIHR